MNETLQLYSAAQELRTAGPAVMRRALVATRERTLALARDYAQALEDAGMRVPYRSALNPPLWELGHVGWFQEYWLARSRERSKGVACDPDHARAPSILEGADALYDSGKVAHRTRWELALPDARATHAYLADSLAQTLGLLDSLSPDVGDADLYFFRLAILHEQMHAEAATYMARALGIALPSALQGRAAPCAKASAPSTATLQVPAQTFLLGYEGPGFAFDNELQAHQVRIEAFEIDAQPVTWGRFMDFAR